LIQPNSQRLTRKIKRGLSRFAGFCCGLEVAA
jgi:hypothetical protein